MRKLGLLLVVALLAPACARLPVPNKAPEWVDVPADAPFDFLQAHQLKVAEKKRSCQRWSDMDFWLGFSGLFLGGVSTTLGVVAQAKDQGSHGRETLLDIATATGGGSTLSLGLQQYTKSQYVSEGCAE